MLGHESSANTVGYNTAVKQTIFAVEDDTDISRLVRHHLEAAGYGVRSFAAPVGVITEAEKQSPALFLLDIMLPGGDGLELCRRIRQTPALSMVPVIFLTAKTTESDKVIGLELGADDYIPKPFSPRELVARVRAVLRRAYGEEIERPQDVYEKGRLRMDFDTYEVALDGKPLDLSLREFELLRFFVRSPNRVFDRLQILDLVWGQDTYVEPRTVDVHVRRLRARIERDDAHPELIVTVRGVGYKFNERALEP